MAHGTTDSVRRRLGKSFDEADHPRDARGRWTSGEGNVDVELDQDDHPEFHKLNSALDRHLGAIHADRVAAADHVKALQAIHDRVKRNHAKAQDALSDYNDLLDRNGYESSEGEEIDSADSFRGDLGDALNGLKPHVHGRKLK